MEEDASSVPPMPAGTVLMSQCGFAALVEGWLAQMKVPEASHPGSYIGGLSEASHLHMSSAASARPEQEPLLISLVLAETSSAPQRLRRQRPEKVVTFQGCASWRRAELVFTSGLFDATAFPWHRVQCRNNEH